MATMFHMRLREVLLLVGIAALVTASWRAGGAFAVLILFLFALSAEYLWAAIIERDRGGRWISVAISLGSLSAAVWCVAAILNPPIQ